MRRADQESGAEKVDTRVSSGGGGSAAAPELYSIHKGQVQKLESFGAFVSMQGFRKQGLLHISQAKIRK